MIMCALAARYVRGGWIYSRRILRRAWHLWRHSILVNLAANHTHRFCYIADGEMDQEPNRSDNRPGSAWGKRAEQLVLQNCCIPTDETLMAMVLCCEYAARTAQHTTVFMLAGYCSRMARLLQLDEKVPTPPSVNAIPADITRQECQRRLLWSCYILDSMAASGIDQDLYWNQGPPQTRLPCGETEFLQRRESVAVVLKPDRGFVPGRTLATELRSCLVVLFQFRNCVLRWVLLRA